MESFPSCVGSRRCVRPLLKIFVMMMVLFTVFVFAAIPAAIIYFVPKITSPSEPQTSDQAGATSRLVFGGRPLAVWLFLVLLLLLVGLYSIGTARFALLSFRVANSGNVTTILTTAGFRCLVTVFLVSIGYGVFYRRSWGKWCGVSMLAACALFSVFSPDTTQYANDAERAGGFLARNVLLPLPLMWWAYSFAFSNNARRYFSGAKMRTHHNSPPAPTSSTIPADPDPSRHD